MKGTKLLYTQEIVPTNTTLSKSTTGIDPMMVQRAINCHGRSDHPLQRGRVLPRLPPRTIRARRTAAARVRNPAFTSFFPAILSP